MGSVKRQRMKTLAAYWYYLSYAVTPLTPKSLLCRVKRLVGQGTYEMLIHQPA